MFDEHSSLLDKSVCNILSRPRALVVPLAHYPKIRGSNPSAGTGREKKKIIAIDFEMEFFSFCKTVFFEA